MLHEGISILSTFYLEFHNWTQLELAAYSKISQSEISKLENNTVPLSKGFISLLAAAFHITESEMKVALRLNEPPQITLKNLMPNNDEAAFAARFYLQINSSVSEMERLELVEKLEQACKNHSLRKRNYMMMIGTGEGG